MRERSNPPNATDRALEEGDALSRLLDAPGPPRRTIAALMKIEGIRVGTLIGLTDDGTTPLVVYSGQPQSAALRARATLDLQASHIGRDIVLMFEDADPRRPIIVGCLHDASRGAQVNLPGQIEVDADGQRLVVSAREQMVLRCGKASITLTRAGKIVIEGAYVANRSSGVLRLMGGSVQIN